MKNEALPEAPPGYYIERIEPGAYAVLDSNYTRIGELWTYGKRTTTKSRKSATIWYTSNTADTFTSRTEALTALIQAREAGAA